MGDDDEYETSELLATRNEKKEIKVTNQAVLDINAPLPPLNEEETIISKAKTTVPIKNKSDDDVKEEDAVKMPSSYRSPRKRARPSREADDENKPFIDHLTKQPLKKRKLNYCNAGTPMPAHLGKVTFKRRRRLFTPAKLKVTSTPAKGKGTRSRLSLRRSNRRI